MEWYSLRVISGKEKKIKDAILVEIKLSGLEDIVKNALVPIENIVEMKDGKKKVRERVFFPGYVLIELEMTKETRHMIENINGVMNFIGSNDIPQPLKPEEINRIL